MNNNIKKKILAENNFDQALKLMKKYQIKNNLDDEIIKHLVDISNTAEYPQDCYIRKK